MRNVCDENRLESVSQSQNDGITSNIKSRNNQLTKARSKMVKEGKGPIIKQNGKRIAVSAL